MIKRLLNNNKFNFYKLNNINKNVYNLNYFSTKPIDEKDTATTSTTPILNNPTILKSPFEKQQEREEKQNQNDNNSKEQESSIPPPPPPQPPKDSVYYKSFRVFVKIFGILNIGALYVLINTKLKKNLNSPNEIYLNFDFLNYLTKDDYDLFSKKIAYQMADKESFFFIFNCLKSNMGQLQLIESGVYQYCIDYLMQQDLELLKRNQALPKATRDAFTLKMGNVIGLYNFESENSDEFKLFTSLIYMTLINLSIEYNKKYKVFPNGIKIPEQLEFIRFKNKRSLERLEPKYNLHQVKSMEAEKVWKNVSFGIGSTLVYMLVRSNRKLFPKFRGNPFTNIVLTSLTTGTLLFFTDTTSKKLYDEKLKSFIQSTGLIPKGDTHLDESWLTLSVYSTIPLLLFQTKFYFVLPFILNSLYLNSKTWSGFSIQRLQQ